MANSLYAVATPILTEFAACRCNDPGRQMRDNAHDAPRARAATSHFLPRRRYRLNTARTAQAAGLDKPLGTAVASTAKHVLVSDFLAKHYGGNNRRPSAVVDEAFSRTTTDHHAIVVAHPQRDSGNSVGEPVDAQAATIMAGGITHQALVSSHMLKLHVECAGTDTGKPVAARDRARSFWATAGRSATLKAEHPPDQDEKSPSRWMGYEPVERGARHCVTVRTVYAHQLAEILRNTRAGTELC